MGIGGIKESTAEGEPGKGKGPEAAAGLVPQGQRGWTGVRREGGGRGQVGNHPIGMASRVQRGTGKPAEDSEQRKHVARLTPLQDQR